MRAPPACGTGTRSTAGRADSCAPSGSPGCASARWPTAASCLASRSPAGERPAPPPYLPRGQGGHRMKQSIHPDYRPVVFRDASADYAFLTRSTATSERTITWTDGNDYPVIDVEVSSASHPFYTGQSKVLDTAGRVERFHRRYGRVAR